MIKTPDEIELIRQSAQLVSTTLGMLAKEIKPGVTGLYLDQLACQFICDHGGKPGFLGMYGFPNTLCISPNEQVVHGVPTNKPIEEGAILSIDCGVLKNEFYGDHAYTFKVGKVQPEVETLLSVTKQSLYEGIKEFKIGNTIGDIGAAIQSYNEKHGYGVVRELVGHGLGKNLHEPPQVPNYGKKGSGEVIKEGMVLAIEPMINMGTYKIRQLKDGWTIITKDLKPSAHFEHTIAVGREKADILSDHTLIENALNKNPNVQAVGVF